MDWMKTKSSTQYEPDSPGYLMSMFYMSRETYPPLNEITSSESIINIKKKSRPTDYPDTGVNIRQEY